MISLSVSSLTGDIIIVSESSNIFIIKYIPLLQQWILTKTPLSGSPISSKVPAIEWLSKNEILLCDFSNISVYKIEHILDELTLVRTWVMSNPVSPILNIVKHCGNTPNDSEYVCSIFNLLTYNDSLVYVWKRTIIDVAEDIYSYQLRLLNTDKQNANTVVWNEWSKFETGDLLYTLNDDQMLRVWQSRVEVLSLSLKELDHDYVFLIKDSSTKNILATIGLSDNHVMYSIHEVSYDHTDKSFVLNTVKQNIKSVSGTLLPSDWTSEDYLEFLVDESSQLLYINNFDQKSTAVVKYCLDSYTFNLIFLASGNTSGQIIIPNNGDFFITFTQTISNLNEITMWKTIDNTIYSKSHMIKFGEKVVKAQLYHNGNIICLLQNKIIIDDEVILYEDEICYDFDVVDGKLFVVLFNRVDKYDMMTLEKEESFKIPNFQQCLIYGHNLVSIDSVRFTPSITKYKLKAENLTTLEDQFIKKPLHFELDSEAKINDCKEGIVALKTLDDKMLFYDTDKMFILASLTISKDLMPDDWILGRNGDIWLVVFNPDHILFYNNSQTKIHKTKIECKGLSLFNEELTLLFENYLENINLSQIFESLDFNEESLLRTFMDIGSYDKAASFFSIIEHNLKNGENLGEKLASEDVFNNKDIWKDKFSYLKVKLKDNKYIINVLLYVNELINNSFPKLSVFGYNYQYKVNIKSIQFKDAVLAIFEKDFLVPDKVDFFAGYKALFGSVESIKGEFEKICKSKFQENKNPHDVGLYYLAMGKLTEFKLLWKYSTKKEATKINNFLVNYNEKICLNNGYKLLSLHRYLEACWFFLLGNDYKSCFYTILKKMNDFHLAVAVITVIDSSGVKLKECLETYCMEYFQDLKMFWEYFYSGLVINDYDMSFVDLDMFILDLSDLESLQKIVKIYGTDNLEKNVFRRLQRIVNLSKDNLVAKYYLDQHKPQQKILFSKKGKEEYSKSEHNLFNSFNNRSNSKESSKIASTMPKSILDDWM